MKDTWTKRQLQTAMRRAGYTRLDAPGSVYEHKNGYTVNLNAWRAGEGYEWQKWAKARETPPPF